MAVRQAARVQIELSVRVPHPHSQLAPPELWSPLTGLGRLPTEVALVWSCKSGEFTHPFMECRLGGLSLAGPHALGPDAVGWPPFRMNVVERKKENARRKPLTLLHKNMWRGGCVWS